MENSPLETLNPPVVEPAVGLFSTLRECAVKALPGTVAVLVLGNLVIGLLSALWADMAPSPPPGWHGQSPAEAPRYLASLLRRPAIREHQFAIVYSIFFVHLVRVRLSGKGRGQPEGIGGWFSQLGARGATRGWLGLLVGNAFGAIFSAIALCWFQRMPWSQRLWNLLLQPLFNQLHVLAADILGQTFGGGVQSWVDWYGANRLRFNFWFFYLAAICDDLGLPNLKTLGRWLWARGRRKLTQAESKSAGQGGQPTQPGSLP